MRLPHKSCAPFSLILLRKINENGALKNSILPPKAAKDL